MQLIKNHSKVKASKHLFVCLFFGQCVGKEVYEHGGVVSSDVWDDIKTDINVQVVAHMCEWVLNKGHYGAQTYLVSYNSPTLAAELGYIQQSN